MSNLAYLCCGQHDEIYPSLQEATFDSDVQVVACCKSHVPLLWLALFRPGDLKVKTLTTDEMPKSAFAPVAQRKLAASRLKEAVPRLQAEFSKNGPLLEHATLLVNALDAIDPRFGYMTLELEEVACLTDVDKFKDQIQIALNFMEGSTATEARAALTTITGLHLSRRFYALGEFETLDLDDEDYENLDRLLGSTYETSVPWETAPPDTSHPFIEAVEAGDLNRVDTHLHAGVDPNMPDCRQSPALCIAARLGFLPIVQRLIKARADVQRWRLVYEATKGGHLEVVRELIRARANLELWSPLSVAILDGRDDIAELLIKAGAPLNPKRQELDRTPLIAACQVGNSTMAKKLIDAGADVSVQAKDRWTPLLVCAERGATKIAAMLLERGADPSAKGGFNRETPLCLAIKNGHAPFVTLLLHTKRLTEPDIQDALNIARNRQREDICDLLRHASSNCVV